jgi:hypothetical protein
MKKDQETLKTCEQNFAFAEEMLRDLMLKLQNTSSGGRGEEKTLRECVMLCEEFMALRDRLQNENSAYLAEQHKQCAKDGNTSEKLEAQTALSSGTRLQQLREQVSCSARVKADSALLHWVENWRDIVEASMAEKTLNWVTVASQTIAQKQCFWEQSVRGVSSDSQGWFSKLKTLRHASVFTNIHALCSVQDERVRWAQGALTRSVAMVEHLAGTVSVFFKVSGHAGDYQDRVVRRVLELELEDDVSKLLLQEKCQLQQRVDSLHKEALGIHREAHALVVEHARAESEKSGKMLQYYARKGEDPSKLIAKATEVQMVKIYAPLKETIVMERLMGVVHEYEKDVKGIRFEDSGATARRSHQEVAAGEGALRN